VSAIVCVLATGLSLAAGSYRFILG
jgi:hypothetical protein